MKKGQQMLRKRWQRMAAVAAAAALLSGAPLGVPRAEAFIGLGDILGGAANAASKSSAIRAGYLDAGDNPVLQDELYKKELGDAAREVDPEAVRVTEDVFAILLEKGDYVLRNDSLPFRLKVVPNNEFNAYCNFTDFICMNDGLVTACGYNRDEVAAILGHEMTHGYNQHTANAAAKYAIADFAGDLASNALSSATFGVGSELTDDWIKFLKVKNINVPNEKDADRNGFYTMASAGFNPGGPAAAMARMSYYTEHRDQFTDFFAPSDHPDTRNRLKDMAALLTAYGIGHPEVRNVNDVYFDKELLLIAEPDGAQDAEEMAYLIAGGIAKGFHDHRFVTDWNFRTLADGRIDFLDDNAVYQPLKNALRAEAGLGARFQTMVERAYESDSKTNARATFLKAELERSQKNAELRRSQAEHTKDAPYKALNGELYMKLGLTDFAEKEFRRASALDPNNLRARSGMATVLSARKDYDGALALVNEVITKAPAWGGGYVSRAIIYRDMGDHERALADCNTALAAKDVDSYAYKVAGDIFDAQGATENALVEYKAYHEANPSAKDIPATYMARLR